MKCSKCQIDLPDGAKFCPACGTKQTGAAPPPAAAAPAAEKPKPAPAPAPQKAAPAPPKAEPPATPPPALAPAPAPATPPAPAAAPPAVAPEPAAAAAPGPAPAGKKLDPKSFAFTADDLSRAMRFAGERAHKDSPGGVFKDLNAYYAAGEKAHIDRTHLEGALHSVALEKMQGVELGGTGRGAAAELFRVHTIDSIPLADLTPKKEKVKAGVLAVVAVVLIVIGVVCFMIYQEWKEGKVEREAAAAAAAAAESAKPPPAPKGELDLEEFRASVEAVNGKVMACCNAELKDKLTEPAALKISARIGLDGKTSNMQIVDDPLKNEVVVGCIQKEVGAHEFAKPKYEPVDVDFSLVFEPAKKKRR